MGDIAAGAVEREDLIMAFVDTSNVRDLYTEYQAAEVEIAQNLTTGVGRHRLHRARPGRNAIALVG